MEWITSNWEVIGIALLAVLRAAESIAELTPTDKDNKVVAVIRNFFTFGWGKKND